MAKPSAMEACFSLQAGKLKEMIDLFGLDAALMTVAAGLTTHQVKELLLFALLVVDAAHAAGCADDQDVPDFIRAQAASLRHVVN